METFEKGLMDELNDVFEEIKDKETSFERLPDGEYLGVIEDVMIGESKAGKPMVTMVFSVTHGKYEGRQHRKFFMLTGNDEAQLKSNLMRFATEIRKLGVDTSKGLTAAFDELMMKVDDEIKFTIKTTINKNGTECVNTSIEVVE